MTTPSTLRLLGGIGALSVLVGHAAGQVNTSQWKCATCPFEKGAEGAAEVGAGIVFGRTARFGDMTGLDKRRGHLVAGGGLRWRDEGGLYVRAAASDLGLDSRAVEVAGGREGAFALSLSYDEVPRRLSDGAATPLRGVGSGSLTLPAGYPAASTAEMPLATTLQGVDLGYRRESLGLGATIYAAGNVELRLGVRRDVRDGTQAGAGAFYANASQLALPLDQTTDQFDVIGSYGGRGLQLTLGYHASLFRNGQPSLSWANPFTPIVAGATRATLALAPDNEFHQLALSAGVDLGARVRASADVAVGRMTQDAAYLPATSNPNLAVGALPASSLRGRANTINASVRVAAAPAEHLRVSATLAHDERDNDTPVAAYPGIEGDVFVSAPASNRPYGYRQSRLRLHADYRAPGWLKGSAGIDADRTSRDWAEARRSDEWKVWARAVVQPLAGLALALKGEHAERRPSDFDALAALYPQENALLRRFNLAQRVRDKASLRADVAIAENVSAGAEVGVAYDDYERSTVGLLWGRGANAGADVTAAIGGHTTLTAYVQADRWHALQAGSQRFGLADWSGDTLDEFAVVGLGVRHLALGGKLDVAADVVAARARERLAVDPGSAVPSFPRAKSERDSVRLQATYKLQPRLWLIGSWWYERRDTSDWKLDGVLPATVPNLLAFGRLAPKYDAHVVRFAVRIGF